MDPWMILPDERARHQAQFQSVGPNPTTGMVTGAQARGFMMQSGLPPMVLAQVWGLADMNGDGQMDVNEFSIACKLITNKLKGLEIPKALPPSIMMNPMAAPVQMGFAGAPMAGAPMAGAPMAGAPGMMGAPAAGMMQPGAMPGMMMPGSIPSAPLPVSAPMQPGMMQPGMGAMPVSSVGMAIPISQAGAYGQGVGMAAGMPGQPAPVSGVAPAAAGAVPAALNTEWAVPQPTRAKYSATFYQTDRARTGFLAGNQARHLLLQSGLPQNVLAQIWGLSDVDADGKLSTEEFILAGHLCDLALKGEPLPPVGQLPPALVPPSQRKGAAAPGAPGTPAGSVNSGDAASPVTFEDKRKENFSKGQAELERRRQSLIDQQKREEEEKKKKEKEEAEAREKQKQEFERKRQIEIERQLARQREIRMQAQEEKKRAEQQRLAARQEMERQRLAEWEKQRKAELVQHRQREQEKVLELKAKKENIDTEFETMRDKVQKLTNDISETRTGVTDVKCFIDGMRTSRDTKMKDMADLKAKLKDQNQRLIQVTQDKARLEAKNKARQAEVDKGNEDELSEFEIKKQEKEKHVEELRAKLSDLKAKEEEKRAKFNEEKEALEEHKQKLKDIIDACKLLYDNFDEKRREVKAEKAKRIRELTDPDHAWDTHEEEPAPAPVAAATAAAESSGEKDHIEYRALYDFESSNPDELPFKSGDIIIVHPGQPHEPGWLGGELNGKVGWFPEAYVELADAAASDAAAATLQPIAEESAASSLTSNAAAEKSDVKMARALYDWTKIDDNDQMSLIKGQQVIVTAVEDPNWWYGKMQDNSSQGYFPANFVTTDALEARGDTPTEPPEVVGSPPQRASTGGDSSEQTCVALFDYVSDEPGDLSFQAGEAIIIVKKEEDWWTGKIGDRVGVFPFNYVEITSAAPAPQEQDTKVDEVKVASDTEPVQDENKTDDQEIRTLEPSNTILSSVQEDPIKPVTPVTFPESGTESETANKTAEQDSPKKKEVNWQESVEKVEGITEPTPVANDEPVVAASTMRQESLQRKDSNVGAGKVEGAGQTGTAKRKKKKKEESEGKKDKKPEIATVVAPYTATSKEQLSLQRGQMILVRKKTSTGWWQGEIQGGKGKKRQLGWFPASYVKLMESAGEKAEVPVQSTTAPAEAEKPAETVDPAPQTIEEPSAGIKFKAMFSYGGQHEDELCFETGDIITLISKDEEAWWKGATADGRTGVFPSNYVELIEYGTAYNNTWHQGEKESIFVTQIDGSIPMSSGNIISDDSTSKVDEERKNVIEEIISTEQNYLECLEIVREIFMKTLGSGDVISLSPQEMEVLFINWNDLRQCSKRLFKSLKIRKQTSGGVTDDMRIGDILCENLSRMDCYVRYCASQLTAASCLQRLVEVKPGFDERLRACQSDKRVQGMPLSYYLLKPVKRITEYPILLEKLLKHTTYQDTEVLQDHPDRENIEEALKIAKQVCDQVNEGMRHKENSERLEWLQIHVDCQSLVLEAGEKLTFNSATNSMGPRKFLHYGNFKKTKSGKSLVAFLFNDFLLLATASLSGAEFSFEKHHDTKLKVYRKPLFLKNLTAFAGDQTQNMSNHSSVNRKSSSLSTRSGMENEELSSSGETKDSGESNNNIITIEIKGSTEKLMENETIDKSTDKSKISNQETTFLLLETKGMHERKLWMQKLTNAITKAKDHETEIEKNNRKLANQQESRGSQGRILAVILEANNLSSRGKGMVMENSKVSLSIPNAFGTINGTPLKPVGAVKLIVVKAIDLKCPKDKAKIDPYLEASMGAPSQRTQRTQVIQGTCNPRWNSSMQFFVRNASEDVLCLTVYDKDYFAPNEFLGRTEIRISDLLNEKSRKDSTAGPLTKKLQLYEAESGIVTVRLDLQLF